jgi:hypothetical protein
MHRDTVLGVILWCAATVVAAERAEAGVMRIRASGDNHPTRLLVRFKPGVTSAQKQVAHTTAGAERVL